MMKEILSMGTAVLTACGAAVAADAEIYIHECTSWLAFHDLTKNNTNLLHKNRDAKPRNIMPLKSRPGEPRKWIGLGDFRESPAPQEFVTMGINTSGLAAVVNSGEATLEKCAPTEPMGTPAIIRECLSCCDTAAQAVKKLEELRKARHYSHGEKGSIFFFMDTREAYIVEMTAERSSAMRYDHGYAFRANIWHNPDMAAAADNPFAKWLNSCNREYMVIRDLNRALRTGGKLAVPDMLELSRDTEPPAKSPEKRTVCSQTTNSASTLEISLSHPDVLSCGYFLIGPPRHTICVPVPVCAEKYLPCMTSLHWSAAAWKRFDKNGFAAPLPPEWQEFETRSLAQWQEIQKQAENLLAGGKKEAAVKLLNDSAYSIWENAAKLMQIE